jgi:hypothetical protein
MTITACRRDRFFLVQHMYVPKREKYTERPQHTEIVHSNTLQNIVTQIWIFDMKIYHLATLMQRAVFETVAMHTLCAFRKDLPLPKVQNFELGTH